MLIQIIEGFVEQPEGGINSLHRGKEHPFAFSSTELLLTTGSQILESPLCDCFLDSCLHGFSIHAHRLKGKCNLFLNRGSYKLLLGVLGDIGAYRKEIPGIQISK